MDAQTYLNLLLKSGLTDEDDLKPVVQEFKQLSAGKTQDWRLLAKLLLRANIITPWHNKNLARGRYKGFFLGKYKLLSLLGTGGMSRVFLAEHTVMRRRVALKILPQNLVNDKAHLERFYIESQATAALDHANIVRAYDVDNEGNVHYLVMEYVDGPDLEQVVKKEGPLSFEKAADYVRQAAEGLAHAHERKMVHRDIKPANLLVASNGTVKILDMGLAQLADYESEGGSDENVMGTTDYIAPEQAMGSQVDWRADIYSLGCTLYYLLAGHPPFPDGTMHEVLLKHQMKEPVSLAKIRSGVPRDLVAICKQMMAKEPDDRYQEAQEVAEALGEWLTEHDAWEGDPSLTGKRSAEELQQLEEMLAQVHRDQSEPKPKRSAAEEAELEGFLTQLDEQSDSNFEDEEDELGEFLSQLDEEQESSGLLHDRRMRRGGTPSPPPRRMVRRSSTPPKPDPSRARQKTPPPPRKRRRPPARATSDTRHDEETELNEFLTNLTDEDEPTSDAPSSDVDLEDFLENLGDDD